MFARSLVGEMNVVDRELPFQRTCAPGTKPEPSTVRTIGAAPAVAEPGLNCDSAGGCGAGVLVAVGGTGVLVGVFVGGTGVLVGVLVGGNGVLVDVLVGGAGVFVGTGVLVGWIAVFVGGGAPASSFVPKSVTQYQLYGDPATYFRPMPIRV